MNKTALLIIGGVLGAIGFAGFGAPVPSMPDERSLVLLPSEADPNSEFMVSFWRAGDGLPDNDIQDLEETPDGYLWLGTYQGLVRYDGVRFQTFFNTPTGLRYGTHVGPLETDVQGRLWIAPDQVGLICRQAKGFQEVLTNTTVLRSRIVSLCSDGTNGLMWVDARGGLGRFPAEQPDQAERIKGAASSLSRWVRDFDGRLWLTGPRNLKLYRQGRWREIKPSVIATSATPRRAGGLWFARQGNLWFARGDGSVHRETVFSWKGQSTVTRLLEDSRGRLWIGTVSQGLFCYSEGQLRQVLQIPSSILCLLEDSAGNIWAGTRGSGLVRVHQRQFFVHDLRSGLKNEFVRSVAQDYQGRVWLLTGEAGIGCWQNGAWHPLGQTEGWPGGDAMSVFPSKNDGVWLSTIRRGLSRWSNGQFTTVELGPNGPKEPAMDLLEDRHGRLWMVTDNSGVFCLDGTNVIRYSTQDGLPSPLVRRIIEDEAGELWAGDWQGGIARFSTNHWEIVRKPSGHCDAVRSMVASDNALWIGTSAGGLLRLKAGQTTRISVEQGLPDLCIQQLLLDGRGSLWGGTPHRLFRISLQQLNAVMDGRLPKIEAITYRRSDGLPDVSFAAWCDPRCWRANDGELWFATANGAIHFHPENLQETKPPQVLIEQTSLDGKLLTNDALLNLRPTPGRLEFRFTAPCLTAPERVRFRCQLTGVDADWVDAGTARTVTYASVPPGEHVFRVLACSPEGVWNSIPATVRVAVHPYFWQTNWFLALIAAVVAGTGVWGARWATVRRLNRRLEILRQQHAVDQERTRIAQDIHDELGANLTSIGLLADMGTRHKADAAAVSRELAEISQTARESVAAMDAIVWALNPRNDSLDHFANYVSQFTRDFFRPTQIRTRLELPADLPIQPLSMEIRHELLLLVKESFNNIVRHAAANEVYVALACQDGQLCLTIADDGKGLPSRPAGEGQDGLANLRCRVERLGGKLQIQTQSGHGSQLQFLVPLSGTKQT